MANHEHLEILWQGVEVWNKWREEHSEIEPDLTHANLSSYNLRKINFFGTNFTGANLSRLRLVGSDIGFCNFKDANLTEAEIISSVALGAKFHSAKLVRADFTFSDLTSVVLCKANLEGAVLTKTIIRDADLDQSNFYQCDMAGTVLSGSDFSNTKGLDAVRHFGPSSIGIDTIYRSQGNIPEVFLRGCGVPEDFIIYVRSLNVQPIQFYKSFISYSSRDQKFADRVYADLQSEGVRCWLASEDLKIGSKIRAGIDEAIRLHDKLLLVLSKHSVVSDWVEQEVETALARERKEKRPILFPIRLDDTVMKAEGGWPALIRNTRNIGDFRKWKQHDSYQKAFDRLLRDLKAETREY